MALPKFDPWNPSSYPGGRAYRAYSAYEDWCSGTSGTLGTHQSALRSSDSIGLMEAGPLHSEASGYAIDAADELLRDPEAERMFGPWMATLLNLGWELGELRSLAAIYGRYISLEGNVIANVRFATSQTIVFGGRSGPWAHCRDNATLKG